MTPKQLLNASLRVTMPDGSRWDVPVVEIAKNRAKNYKSEFGGSVARSLKEDTVPLFCEGEYEITDWAANNMNWVDVVAVAKRVPDKPQQKMDWQDGWCNGEKEIVVAE